jgi:hypothetical protein
MSNNTKTALICVAILVGCTALGATLILLFGVPGLLLLWGTVTFPSWMVGYYVGKKDAADRYHRYTP